MVLALQTALSGDSPATGISGMQSGQKLLDLNHPLTRASDTASSTITGQSSPSSQGGSSSTPGSSPSPVPSPSFSPGAKAGVAVSCIAIVVGVVVGWWKKHQVLWLITCGKRGHKRSDRSQQAQGNYPLERIGNGGY